MRPVDFDNALNSGKFENVYYFAGEEELKKREALDRLRQMLLPVGLEALNEVTLEDCDAQAIIDNAILMPVMCDRRIVIVRDWPPFVAAKKDQDSKTDEAPAKNSASKKPADVMREWLNTAPDSCVIVFLFSKPVKTFISKEQNYIDFTHLTGAALRDELGKMLKPYGKTLKNDAFDELTLMAGTDLTRLSTELDKLAAYTQKSRNITLEDVRAVVTPSPEYSVFNILDSLLDNNIGQATLTLNSLMKQSDNNPTRIITLFISSMRVYLLLKLADENGGIGNDLMKVLNVSEYRKKFVVRRFRSVSSAELQERYDACIQADVTVKSGNAKDNTALDALMLKLLYVPKATSTPGRSSNRI